MGQRSDEERDGGAALSPLSASAQVIARPSPAEPASIPSVSAKSPVPDGSIQPLNGQYVAHLTSFLVGANHINSKPLILDDDHTPFERSQSIYDYALMDAPIRNWNCRLSSPPAFPASFDIGPSPGNASKKAIVVWRGKEPGVYGN